MLYFRFSCKIISEIIAIDLKWTQSLLYICRASLDKELWSWDLAVARPGLMSVSFVQIFFMYSYKFRCFKISVFRIPIKYLTLSISFRPLFRFRRHSYPNTKDTKDVVNHNLKHSRWLGLHKGYKYLVCNTKDNFQTKCRRNTYKKYRKPRRQWQQNLSCVRQMGDKRKLEITMFNYLHLLFKHVQSTSKESFSKQSFSFD